MKLLNTRKEFTRFIARRKGFKLEEKLDGGIAKKQISFSYPVEDGRISCEDILEYGDEHYAVKESTIKGNWGTVTAAQDTAGLSGNPKASFSIQGGTVLQCAREAISGSIWKCVQVSGNSWETRNFSEENTDSMKLLERIAEAFWVEIAFSAKERTVYLYGKVHTRDTPVKFVKGINLKSIEVKTDSYDFYTRIQPIGKDGLTIAGVNGGRDYLENTKYRSSIRTLRWEDTNYKDAETLKNAAEKKLEELAAPKTAYTAQIADIASLDTRYKEFVFGLGDSADISDMDTGVYACERIVQITRYPDNPEKNTVELSSRKQSFADMQKKMFAASDSISNVVSGNKISIRKVDGLQEAIQGTVAEAVKISADNIGEKAPHLLTSGRVPSADKWQTTRYLEGIGVDGTANRHHYTTCSTSGSTAAKTASLTGFSLLTGARVEVLFLNANTASNPTLNISSTGAKSIYYRNGAIPANYIQAGTVLELVYSGSYWRVVGDLAQYQADVLKTENSTLKAEHDALAVRISPTLLYSSTLYASALNTWIYASVPSLKDWKEVRMWLEVGDADCRYNTLTREHMQICVNGYANANYNGLVRVSCDFTNARIGLLVRSMTGWGFSNIRITRVEGVVKV
ncbi:phage tail spike protein [Hominisplanchenecus murintestinalis]|uniref:phage tail spike protein n=2 Tax=Hominisplanchenecus murintestinalis TaxID=2941517 RepID=UPI0020422C07|nr:phage tail spike protein [Hominisplanchenecus murintestinalis]